MIASNPFYICSVLVFPHAFAVAITFNFATFLWSISTSVWVEPLRLTFAVPVPRDSLAFPACHSRSFALAPAVLTAIYKGGDAIHVIEEGQAEKDRWGNWIFENENLIFYATFNAKPYKYRCPSPLL